MTTNDEIRARRAAAHDVPTSGTLHEMSYCRRCGAPFDSIEPCPGNWRWYGSVDEPQIGDQIRGLDLDGIPNLAGREPGSVIRTERDLFAVRHWWDQVEYIRPG